MTHTETDPFDPAKSGWERPHLTGFLELVGPIWQRREANATALGFLVEAKHENRRGVLQGGMMATLIDRTIGINVSEANGNVPQATLQLDLHFIGAVQVGEFVEARCTIDRRTRSVTFASATASVGSRNVATATGIWKILGVH